MGKQANTVRLYLTPDYACSYLPGQQARNVVVDPAEASHELYDRLIERGFRRSGEHIYRPRCEACEACNSLRIPAAQLHLNRTLRRCEQRNQDLSGRWLPAHYTDEHYYLYQRYVNNRHPDGGMHDADQEAYRSFFLSEWCNSHFFELRHEQRLVAVAVIDRMSDGLSAVYTFFDPALAIRGLGNYVILRLASEAAEVGLAWVYLGYWIDGCAKMAYKANFVPHQVFQRNQWVWRD